VDVALKIDVDTHRGLVEGVPRLARALLQEAVEASFFIAMGPDNSGRAIIRVFRNRGFLRKMVRTRAVAMYGLRTMLSGTLLPARQIARARPGLVRSLREDGFEVGVHGYDHVRWQDGIDRLGDQGLRAELQAAFGVYREIFGDGPFGFAAPGWRTNTLALQALDEMGLRYRSDTRGTAPFRTRVAGVELRTIEIPTTLPTFDEVIGRGTLNGTRSIVNFYLERFSREALNVHTIHAETEGMGQLDVFLALIRALKENGANFVRMCDYAQRLDRSTLPLCDVVRITLEGRAGWVAGQGAAISTGAA
jgi:undecaprenyl phosphate-alpha-L-ara4FN deformylase